MVGCYSNVLKIMMAQLSILKASRAVCSRAQPLIETSLCSMGVLPSSSYSNRQASIRRTAQRTNYVQRSSFCTKGAWNSREKTDLDGLTPIDIEKALFRIKRTMGSFYSKGDLDRYCLVSVSHSLLVMRLRDCDSLYCSSSCPDLCLRDVS